MTVSGNVTEGVGSAATTNAMTGTWVRFTATGTTWNQGNGTAEAASLTLGNGNNTITYSTLNLGVSGSANGAMSTLELWQRRQHHQR